MFPNLDRILFLDHDVCSSEEPDQTLGHRSEREGDWSSGNLPKQRSFISTDECFHQFSDPFLFKRFDVDSCTWAFGMNLIDLNEWRQKDLTALYHQYLQLEHGKAILSTGSLPLGWLTFYDQTFVLDRRWLVLRLGHDIDIPESDIERGAVLHYDGVMKPWLDIGIAKYKQYWSSHVSYEHLFLQQCKIHP